MLHIPRYVGDTNHGSEEDYRNFLRLISLHVWQAGGMHLLVLEYFYNYDLHYIRERLRDIQIDKLKVVFDHDMNIR